jgi:RecG-like helicase
MDIICTNSSFCGSGKTFDATTAAEGKKTCIAVPSRRLAKQVLRDACLRFPQLKSRIACFVSNPKKGETAISRIAKYLLDERGGEGDLLIITHAALQMIAHWRDKGQWHLIVDEEITSECHIPVRLR